MATSVNSGKYQFQGVFSKLFVVKVTAVDIASLADGAGDSTTITATGVALGDMVLGVSFGVSTVGMTVTADVTATDTVILRVQNESGSTVDLASTTVYLVIGRIDPNVIPA